jgi:hypothetical protein
LAVVLVAGAIFVFATRGVWLEWISRSLVCVSGGASGQAIVLDYFDSDIGVFARGAQLQRGAGSIRALIPVTFSDEPFGEAAAMEVARALARVSGLSNWQTIAVPASEPISLNVAYSVRDFLLSENITSVTLISPEFRSRRSDLIYRAVLEERDISVACLPTFRTEKWTSRWHGIQDVTLQFMKLQYYRFWVLPLR